MRVLAKLSAVCLAIVLASACSSSSPKTSAPPSTVAITKASYLVKANAICKTMNSRVAAVPAPGHDPKKAAAAIDQQRAIVDQTLQQLRALPVPAGQGAQLEAVYATVDKVIAATAAYSAAVRAGDKAAATAAAKQIIATQTRANAASIKYGLTVCGS